MSTIDFEKMREELRATYANYPTNGDPVLEFEKRNAGLVADIIVMVAKEEMRETSPAEVVEGIAALASCALSVVTQRVKNIDKEGLCRAFSELVTGFVAHDEDVTYTVHKTPMKGDA